MAWKDKSHEIALELLGSMDESYTRVDVLHALEEAALRGMAYECDIAVMPLLYKLNHTDKNEHI